MKDVQERLWEGRYKSIIISSKEYLLACSRYIELNLLRAGMVTKPEDYRWSRYPTETTGIPDSVIDFDRIYAALGNNKIDRQRAYRKYISQTISEDELRLIRDAVQRNQVTGSNRFREQLEKKHTIRLSNRGPGRPKKERN